MTSNNNSAHNGSLARSSFDVQITQPSTPDMIGKLGLIMTHISSQNPTHNLTTPFHHRNSASMSLVDYMGRLEKYMHCTPECYVIASVLITRLEKIVPDLITPLSAHRLVLTAVVLGAKTHDDVYLTNSHYADVGGIPLDEMNRLEKFFLEQLDFVVFVSNEDYEFCRKSLLQLHDMLTNVTAAATMDHRALGRMRSSSSAVDLVVGDVLHHAELLASPTSSEVLDEFTYGRTRNSSTVSAIDAI